MCPNMFFGIMIKVNAEINLPNIQNSLDVLQVAHPLLSSRVNFDEQGTPFFAITNKTAKGGQTEQNAKPRQTGQNVNLEETEQIIRIEQTNQTWNQVFNDISSKGWDVRSENLLKVYVFENDEKLSETSSFQILFVVHHILCDGRGLLSLAMEFADYYVNKKAPAQENFFAINEIKLLENINDLPPKSKLPFISNLLIQNMNNTWIKENKRVPYDTYLTFEKEFSTQNDIDRNILSDEDYPLDEIVAICKKNGISVNDFLVAKMMQTHNTNKVILASDIRTKLQNYKTGTLGNFATAFSVVVKDSSKEIIKLAQEIHTKVAKIQNTPSKEMLVLACYFTMNPTLIDAVAISSLEKSASNIESFPADVEKFNPDAEKVNTDVQKFNHPTEKFESNAGKFVGDKMFGYATRNGYSITNLGKIESDSIKEGFFIPPASPATKKTWGVLTINGKMKIVESCYS